MKQLLLVAAMILAALGAHAQESRLYLVLELMEVEPENGTAYMEAEDFWEGIHEQRIKAGEIIGWDLWAFPFKGTDQGYPYMTVTLYNDPVKMLNGFTLEQLLAYAKAAHPDLTEEEIMAKLNATGEARELAIRIMAVEINSIETDYDVQEGTFASMAWMKVSEDGYEHYHQMEEEIFKPMHEASIKNGEMAGWTLLQFLSPQGAEPYASHVAVNFYENVEQFVGPNTSGSEMTTATEIGIEEGLKSRVMKSMDLARCLKAVR